MTKELSTLIKRILDKEITCRIIRESYNANPYNGMKYIIEFNESDSIEVDRLSFLELVEEFSLEVKNG